VGVEPLATARSWPVKARWGACVCCGAVGEAGDEVEEAEEEDDDDDDDSWPVPAEMDEMVESAKSVSSAPGAAATALVLLPSTVVRSLSCSTRLCSRSSGGDSSGLLGGLPTIFQLSSAVNGARGWIGRGEASGGVTMPDCLLSMRRVSRVSQVYREYRECRVRRVCRVGARARKKGEKGKDEEEGPSLSE
jgi:hypothetical protein